jgi:DNA (cytosine-5)-methyltransferase 1
LGDITKISSDEIPIFDILLAGFPCQPFSQAGLKKGFSDTRGTLFFEIERIIKDKRPSAFLLENVKQLKGHDSGRTLATIMKHLEELDYDVKYKVLRAADFGVPQNRERLFIIGFDKKRMKPDTFQTFEFPVAPNTPTCVGNILEDKVDEKYTISDKLYQGHIRRKQEHIEKGHGFGFCVFTENSSYTNTISARYYKDGSEILIEQKDGKNPRKLTPRECARLQGFPPEFIIPVSDTQAYKQFGNSVAVPVVAAVAESMIDFINTKGLLTPKNS